MASTSGVPSSVSTSPRACTVGSVPFAAPIPDDEWNLIVAAWSGGKEVVVSYEVGPPKVVTKVASA